MGAGHLVDEIGVCAWGVVAASVAGLGLRDVTSLFNRVMVGLGDAQGPSDGKGVDLGPAMGDRSSLNPLWHSFTLGLTSGVGERAPFAWGAVSSMIEAAAGLGHM